MVLIFCIAVFQTYNVNQEIVRLGYAVHAPIKNIVPIDTTVQRNQNKPLHASS